MDAQAAAGSAFGVGVLSSAIAGYGKIAQGQDEKKAYDYNAAITIANTNAKMVANEQQTSTLVGRQATAYAGAGVDIASGSALLVMAATRARGAQQGEAIEQAGTEEAQLQRYYGKIAAFSGTMAGIGAFLNGVSASGAAYAKTTSNPSPSAGGGGSDSFDSGL